jgi:hypothetical protein
VCALCGLVGVADMTEILIGKLQQPFLQQFLPTSLLGVSAAIRAENCGG